MSMEPQNTATHRSVELNLHARVRHVVPVIGKPAPLSKSSRRSPTPVAKGSLRNFFCHSARSAPRSMHSRRPGAADVQTVYRGSVGLDDCLRRNSMG